jgi:hypothetical protein
MYHIVCQEVSLKLQDDNKTVRHVGQSKCLTSSKLAVSGGPLLELGIQVRRGFCNIPLRLLSGHLKLLLCPPYVPAGSFPKSLGRLYSTSCAGWLALRFTNGPLMCLCSKENISRAVLWCVSSAMYCECLTFLGLLSNFEWI